MQDNIKNEMTTPEPVEPEPVAAAPDSVEQVEQPAEPDAAPAAEQPGDGQLGEAGQRALAAERERRREVERELREQREELREMRVAQARRDVASELRLTGDQAALLQGEDAGAMRAHGEALIAAFARPAEVRRRPQERLTPGGVPSGAERPSASALADAVLND